MNIKRSALCLFYGIMLGFCSGLVMMLPTLPYLPCRGVSHFLSSAPCFRKVYEIIHLPATEFMILWDRFQLPPHGDDRFYLIPVSIVMQWTVVGFLISLFVVGCRVKAAEGHPDK